MSDNNIHDKVLEILRKYPEARNSDNVLVLLFWSENDDKYFQRVIDLLGTHNIARLTALDTIRRWRQKIQNEENLYKAERHVIEGRLEKQVEMRRQFSHD